jgi:uncharacterized membrane protein YidH (DUF202 family)
MTQPVEAPRGLLAIGAAGLAIEALVVLLATPAVLSLDRGQVSAVAVGCLLALFVLLCIGAGVIRRSWGKRFGTVIQPLVFLTGFFTWPMFVIGVIFGAIWVYYLHLWQLT